MYEALYDSSRTPWTTKIARNKRTAAATGTAALVVPYTSVLASTGGWTAVFIAAAALNFIAAALAIFALKPLRARLTRSTSEAKVIA